MKYIPENEAVEQYDELLNEIYGPINVGIALSASEVLLRCDEIAYRQGFLDWLDAEGLTTDEDEADEDEDEADEDEEA